MYRNATPLSQTNNSSTTDLMYLRVGTRIARDIYGRNLYGDIQQVAIWDKALSLSEVELLYNNGNGNYLS